MNDNEYSTVFENFRDQINELNKTKDRFYNNKIRDLEDENLQLREEINILTNENILLKTQNNTESLIEYKNKCYRLEDEINIINEKQYHSISNDLLCYENSSDKDTLYENLLIECLNLKEEIKKYDHIREDYENLEKRLAECPIVPRLLINNI